MARAAGRRTIVLVGCLLASVGLALFACGGHEALAQARIRTGHAAALHNAAPPRDALRLSIGAPLRVHPIPAGFLGLSIEYPSIEPYAGSDANEINPLLVQLIHNLAPNQRPVIRIGGDSTDWMWWPVPHMKKPRGVRFTLTPRWLAVTKALTKELNAKLIMGLNLEANSQLLATQEASTFLNGIGRQYIYALEPGNEPELYGSWPWYVARDGTRIYGRPAGWRIEDYERELAHLSHVLRGAPLAGPATGGPRWTAELPQFVDATPYLKLITLHSYPLQLCYVPASDPRYPTIGHLLSSQASTGLAERLAPYVRLAHAHGKPIRIGEMNTNSCGSAPAVTKSPATALWALDALFAIASVGVDGVNIHTYNHSSYELFSFTRARGQWRAHIYPEYYGLELFAQGAPPGSRLLQARGPATRAIRVWATRGPDGHIRITLINDDLERPRTIKLKASAHATLTTLTKQAPGLTTTTLAPTAGYFVIGLAPASAALLTR